MDFSTETLKARFDELTAQRKAIDEQLEPLWAELSNIGAGETKLTVKAAIAREAEIRAQVRELQDQLVPIEQERGNVARALGGKTGTLQAPEI